jgi:hypothetical protein
MKHGSKKLCMQGGMAKTLLKAIPFDVTTLGVHASVAEF